MNPCPLTTRLRQRRPSVNQDKGSGSRWLLNRRHQRGSVVNRNTVDDVQRVTGVTTLDQQRPVRQEKAATRHDHSRRRYVNDVRPATPPSHSTPLDSTASPVDGSTTALLFRGPWQYDNSSVHQLRQTFTTQRQHTRTAVRQLVRLSNSSVTIRRTQHSDNFIVDYCGYCCSPREQLSYSSSVPLTMCLGDSHQPSHRLL